ncbi:MAG: hypothetical protein EBU85_02015, partial [Actinobacteria bacterium]|nr:hypothetical protein [Actinomycetota bacterium]
MPTYQYRCTGCDASLEVVQSFTDDALTTCEACGGALRKVFSGVGVVFKGSGFYRNDSRAGAGSGASKVSAASASSSGDSGSSGTTSGSSGSGGSSAGGSTTSSGTVCVYDIEKNSVFSSHNGHL